jgi:hypothetical protein
MLFWGKFFNNFGVIKYMPGAFFFAFKSPISSFGARGGVVVKALRYKPAGRVFDSRCCHWNFSVT